MPWIDMREAMRTMGVCLLLAVATVIAVTAPATAGAASRGSAPAPWGLLAVLALVAAAALLAERRARPPRGGGPRRASVQRPFEPPPQTR